MVLAGGACVVIAGFQMLIEAGTSLFIGIATQGKGGGDLDPVEDTAPLIKAASILEYVGGALFIIGYPIELKGRSTKRDLCTIYNNATNRYSSEVIFGPTKNGIGIRLLF